MEPSKLKIKSIEKATHDVLRFVTEKPDLVQFMPGQAADISINKDGWQKEIRPFTFTNLPDDDYVEFTIKTYPERKSVTNELRNLRTNDELLLHGIFGTIAFKGEGIFIAGGAGVTPFISIIRSLKFLDEIGNNKLIFANKTKADIINEAEFKDLLGNNFINILSDEKTNEYASGYITEEFLRQHAPDIQKHFYLCGPPQMMDAVEKHLLNMNVNENSIVKEVF
jgi:ferredoxin-NADP reductase